MTKEQFARVMSLFDSACSLSPDERKSFLNVECRGDDEVRRSVEAMLAHDRNEDRKNDPMVGAPPWRPWLRPPR